MRDSCLLCAIKHVAQAGILSMEALQGYPLHHWWALGHLAEAADELVADYPEMANELREYRKQYEDDPEVRLPYAEIIATLDRMIDDAAAKSKRK